MNDRYLFRGKRADNGECVEGVPYFKNGKCVIITRLFGCEEYQCTGAEIFEVIPETIGQCTGLKDKNGKLIFEGDILLFTNDDGEKTPYKVCWSEKYAEYTIITNDGATDTMDYWSENREYFELIGNIHDNPELLKGKEDKKMRLIVDNYERDRITLEHKLYKSFCVEGDTMTDCFKRMYDSERSARYCSGTSYRFRDDSIQEKYKEWKQHGVTFEMYYGNATVD